ncbi:AraC family transcriptional regulator [Marinobacter litoralis]|uniref:AraC family transcriptional regulator n=1 Tax=Marinobacter litoralis TaxID=187981 RepID=UPI0018EA7B66|nr:AraC family transcriptional regulator [Marinobacter litoralis]MBJ6136256.1 AraC family transcriptional regulator [Marinobacter litoralis]
MGVSVSNTQDLGMPAIYLHTLAELLHTIGVDERDLIQRVGLDPARLKSTDLRVSEAQAAEFVTRAIVESGEPGLGILLARELELPLHGALGTAVMSSRTLEEALELVTRYLTLRVPHLKVEKHMAGSSVWYAINCEAQLGSILSFILDAVLFGCISMGTQLLGTTLPGLRIMRRGPEPSHFHRFRRMIGVPVEFGASEDALVVPISHLSHPTRFSNQHLAETSREECEQALQQLEEVSGVASKVRRVIEASHPFPPKLARAASTLFVSERTLKRRLQEEGASFQSLVDEVRLERAQDLLENTTMNLTQIADALGYADAANFTRAFKRWTGNSPSQYRIANSNLAKQA